MSDAYAIIQAGWQVAECVPFSDLREGTFPYYLEQPLTVNKNTLPHYRNLEEQDPNTLVWVIYSVRQNNPWIKKVEPMKWNGLSPALGGLINSVNSDFTINKVRS